jgi:Bifunctional DNA primase/polymerase, N-terminal/AAA domain/Primase C terminal 1 (PriCT-1)
MGKIEAPIASDKEEPTHIPKLEAALSYAARGWHVIPLHHPTPNGCSCQRVACSSLGKHPRTPTGLKEGTIDEAQITRWWKFWPDANVGIVTGSISRLCVLDVDGADGLESLQRLTGKQGLPDTIKVLTGRLGTDGSRNGYHLYFELEGHEWIRSSAGTLGKGLDVRGDGGYIVAPPSLHASGLQYEWEESGAVVSSIPAWMLAAIPRPSRPLNQEFSGAILEGRRNSTLTSLAGSMRSKGMSPSAIEVGLLEENRQRCSPPLPEQEIRAIVASVGKYPAHKLESQPGPISRPHLIWLSDVKSTPISWLWEPYIPRGMITILSGNPGVGKTFICLAISAALSRGEQVVSRLSTEPVNVLYLTTENSPEHVLRPRFDTLNGDPSRFIYLSETLYQEEDTEMHGTIRLSDTEQLKLAVVESQASLVIIDPLQSFLGASVDLHRSNETRPILDGLSRIAEHQNCAIVIVRHLSKGIGGSAIYRGLGSIDLTGAARSELLVATDPTDSARRILAHAKSNLGRQGDSITYTINDDGTLLWGLASELTADALLMAPPTEEARKPVTEAKEFLTEVLANGPQKSIDVQEQARARGIKDATLRRAKEALEIVKRPAGFGESWCLELPRVAHEKPELLT